MSDRGAVLEANAAFYAAFESLDLKRMQEVWLRAPYIKCVHPGWGRLVGWGPVMQSWERIFSGTRSRRSAKRPGGRRSTSSGTAWAASSLATCSSGARARASAVSSRSVPRT